MKIVDKLKSISNGGGSVEAIERVITEFEVQRDTANARISNFDAARRELLFAADTVGLAKLRADRLEAEDLRDAAEAALATIRGRLIAARDAQRATRWDDITGRHDVAIRRYFDSARIALSDFHAVIAIRDAAIREGFAAELRSTAILPAVNGNPILAPDLLDMAAAEHERLTRPKSASRVAKSAAPPTKLIPADRRAQELAQRRLPPTVAPRAVQPQTVPREFAAPLENETGPTGADEVLARVLKSGFPGADGRASQRGRIVRIDKRSSEHAEANGAVEIIRPGTMVEPIPSTDKSTKVSTQQHRSDL